MLTGDFSRAISQGRIVSLRYIMRDQRGEVLEDRMSGEPAVYLQGGTAILPALQQQLEGLCAGDRRRISLSIYAADGDVNFSFDVLIISVRTASNAETVLGYPLPVAGDCGPDCDCYSDSLTGQKNSAGKYSAGKNPNA